MTLRQTIPIVLTCAAMLTVAIPIVRAYDSPPGWLVEAVSKVVDDTPEDALRTWAKTALPVQTMEHAELVKLRNRDRLIRWVLATDDAKDDAQRVRWVRQVEDGRFD